MIIQAARYADERQPPAVARLPFAKKRLIEHLDAGLLDPRFRRQIGAGGYSVEQSELGQHQGAGTLCAKQLPRRIELQLCHQSLIRNHFAGLPAAAHDDRVCGAGFVTIAGWSALDTTAS